MNKVGNTKNRYVFLRNIVVSEYARISHIDAAKKITSDAKRKAPARYESNIRRNCNQMKWKRERWN